MASLLEVLLTKHKWLCMLMIFENCSLDRQTNKKWSIQMQKQRWLTNITVMQMKPTSLSFTQKQMHLKYLIILLLTVRAHKIPLGNSQKCGGFCVIPNWSLNMTWKSFAPDWMRHEWSLIEPGGHSILKRVASLISTINFVNGIYILAA